MENNVVAIPLGNNDSIDIGNDKNVAAERTAIGCFVYIRGYVCGRICNSETRLSGKTAIITGGNTGMGKEIALDLASRGAKVIITSRNTQRGNEAAQEIYSKVPGAIIVVKRLDLGSFSSIRSFAEDILISEPYIHILINNAGIAFCPKSTTEDGFEMQFGVNHLGHFLLTNLLLNRIKTSAPARIVIVSSLAHKYGKIDFNDINLDQSYNSFFAYNRSKLANILFTRELAKRLKGTGVTTYSVHPGVVHTGQARDFGSSSFNRMIGHIHSGISRLTFKSAYKGAQTTIYCAVEEALAGESGHYYCDCIKILPSKRARDDTLAEKLWDVSENLISAVP